MIKNALIFSALFSLAFTTNAQTQSWQYDFGNTEASFNPNPGAVSTNFLPKAGANASKSLKQVVRVRTGSDGSGEFNLVKTGADFIKGVGLEIKPAVANSKFSIYNIEGTSLSSMAFQIKFDDAKVGQWVFANGNSVDKEDAFQGHTNVKDTNTEIFAGLRWMVSDANEIKFYNRVDNKWLSIKGVTFLKNTDYAIAVFSNNSSTDQAYKKDGENSLKANTYDVWINDKKAVTSIGGSVSGATINALLILGYKPKNTEAKPRVWVDNLAYADHL